MKFATALLALATAAMASPTKFALEERHSDCKTCEWEHHQHGYGRHHGSKRHCKNWVTVTEELVVIDVHAEICLNLEAVDLGLLAADVDAVLDVEIDVALLRYRYPDSTRLFCNPKETCTKGERIREDECWEHEFKTDNSHESNY